MSADGLLFGAETDVSLAVIDALRVDPNVQAELGDPARVFDSETREAAYPYAVLERHEVRPANSSEYLGQEHRLTFATLSRHDGLREAKAVLGALRSGVDGIDLALVGQNVVLAHVTYSDAMRSRDRRVFRGILRVRIITEEQA